MRACCSVVYNISRCCSRNSATLPRLSTRATLCLRRRAALSTPWRTSSPVDGASRCGDFEANCFVERGHLARICLCGRDARAPGLPGGTPALRVLPPREGPLTGLRRPRRSRGPAFHAGSRFRSRSEPQAPFTGLVGALVNCGRDARAPRFADGVQADSPVERGHLARICDGGRDARAPGLPGETPALRVLSQREGPSTGLGPWRCPANTRHECRAEDRLRRQTPVNGRLRTTSCPRFSRCPGSRFRPPAAANARRRASLHNTCARDLSPRSSAFPGSRCRSEKSSPALLLRRDVRQ